MLRVRYTPCSTHTQHREKAPGSPLKDDPIKRFSFHPEMVFLANLGVNLPDCLRGDHQVASAQTLDCLDIGQTGTRPAGVGLRTRSV